MSNTIAVNNSYYAFRFVGNTLQAFIKGVWVEVVKTSKKNQHGDRIFAIVNSK